MSDLIVIFRTPSPIEADVVRGLLDATWEPGPDGRPPRHLYRLSAAGREYVAALPVAAQPAARANRAASRPHLRGAEAS